MEAFAHDGAVDGLTEGQGPRGSRYREGVIELRSSQD
jgi:hypothetical protein